MQAINNVDLILTTYAEEETNQPYVAYPMTGYLSW